MRRGLTGDERSADDVVTEHDGGAGPFKEPRTRRSIKDEVEVVAQILGEAAQLSLVEAQPERQRRAKSAETGPATPSIPSIRSTNSDANKRSCGSSSRRSSDLCWA